MTNKYYSLKDACMATNKNTLHHYPLTGEEVKVGDSLAYKLAGVMHTGKVLEVIEHGLLVACQYVGDDTSRADALNKLCTQHVVKTANDLIKIPPLCH